MSYANLASSDNPSNISQYVLLVQSNPQPVNVDAVDWTLVAVWPRVTSYPQDYSPVVCNVDQTTGVFSMMSNFSLTDSFGAAPDANLLPKRSPGGFQYDPRTDNWSDFTLAPGYRWGDVSHSYALFQWPGTTTLVQANIGASTTVNLGILEKSNGSNQFVNTVSWDLDPALYGYPKQLAYGNGALYHFGTVVDNNVTGALRTVFTRIPLSGDPHNFSLPATLPIYNSSGLSKCGQGGITPRYYKDTLYIFCQEPDSYLGSGYGYVMTFKDGKTRDSSISNPTIVLVEKLGTSIIQPCGGSEDGTIKPFAYVLDPGSFTYGIALDIASIGHVDDGIAIINITEPYGALLISPPPNRTPAIIGGSVAGALVLLALVLFFVLRRRWPEWRSRLGAKVLEMIMKDENETNGNNKTGKGGIYKIEDPSSSSSFGAVSGDKILVVEDMEEGLVDLTTGYMREVELQHHPRPTIVTSLMTDSAIGSDDDGAESIGYESGSSPLSRRALVLTPQRSSPVTTTAATMTSTVPPSSDSHIVQPQPAALSPAPASIPPSILPLPLTTSAMTQHLPSAPQLYTPTTSVPARSEAWSLSPSKAPFDRRLAPSSLLAATALSTPAEAIEADELELMDVAPPYSQHNPNVSSPRTPTFPTPPTPSAPVFILEELRNYNRARPRSPHAVVENGGTTNPPEGDLDQPTETARE
ncbi:hypothetical protein BGX28_004125 [Mortierella sp. GBA30]|nr:hypothetical protein BGX28_004125 [Mortierella sp. GBA30]